MIPGPRYAASFIHTGQRFICNRDATDTPQLILKFEPGPWPPAREKILRLVLAALNDTDP